MHKHLKINQFDSNKKAIEEFCKNNPEFKGTIFLMKPRKSTINMPQIYVYDVDSCKYRMSRRYKQLKWNNVKV